MSDALRNILLERIRSSGPLTFASFMAEALYNTEHGYYKGDVPRTGWQGHYVTSPELDPAFGELWAEGIRQVWEATGTPDVFEVVEIGPGEGGFAKAVLDALKGPLKNALRYTLVERSPHARQRQKVLLGERPNVSWCSSLDRVPQIEFGLVFANEILDNLPVHMVEQHGGRIQEIYVTEQNGSFLLHLGDPSSPDVLGFLARHAIGLRNGTRFEVPLAAESFVRQASEMVRWGAIVFIDYGAETDELMTKPEGTLVCYSAAGTDPNPLERPGEKDLTVFVNWSSARKALADREAEPVGPITQRDVLIKLGLAEMDARFRDDHGAAMISGRGVDAVRALSRRQALAAIADPGGLGGQQVLVGLKGIAMPPFLRTTI